MKPNASLKRKCNPAFGFINKYNPPSLKTSLYSWNYLPYLINTSWSNDLLNLIFYLSYLLQELEITF